MKTGGLIGTWHCGCRRMLNFGLLFFVIGEGLVSKPTDEAQAGAAGRRRSIGTFRRRFFRRRWQEIRWRRNASVRIGLGSDGQRWGQLGHRSGRFRWRRRVHPSLDRSTSATGAASGRAEGLQLIPQLLQYRLLLLLIKYPVFPWRPRSSHVMWTFLVPCAKGQVILWWCYHMIIVVSRLGNAGRHHSGHMILSWWYHHRVSSQLLQWKTKKKMN